MMILEYIIFAFRTSVQRFKMYQILGHEKKDTFCITSTKDQDNLAILFVQVAKNP